MLDLEARADLRDFGAHANGRPARLIALERLDDEATSGVFMNYMIETILTDICGASIRSTSRRSRRARARAQNTSPATKQALATCRPADPAYDPGQPHRPRAR